ncbi:MAG: DUF429 domain-containing protein [Cryomorphaceae bacterium]|nr:DUF429 domain-containing protein [Cryomorphaceae bacterium]
MQDKIIFGIDFGSKLSGNTVIAIFKDMRIDFLDVDKGVDADTFILNAVKHYSPEVIFIDAPLSLPGRYAGIKNCDCYNFRHADKELKAMSPMFLGGLTARAIRIKDECEKLGIEVRETYPKAQSTKYDLQKLGYKGNKLALRLCAEKVMDSMHPGIRVCAKEIISWHHLDALLALVSAMCFVQGCGQVFGREDEGQIFI